MIRGVVLACAVVGCAHAEDAVPNAIGALLVNRVQSCSAVLISGLSQASVFRLVMIAGGMFYLPDGILWLLAKRGQSAAASPTRLLTLLEGQRSHRVLESSLP